MTSSLPPPTGRTRKLADLIVKSPHLATWTDAELDDLCHVLLAPDTELAYAVRQFFSERMAAYIAAQRNLAVNLLAILVGKTPNIYNGNK